MSLIKSHIHHSFTLTFLHSMKVTFESIDKNEKAPIDPRTEYHHTYEIRLGHYNSVDITFMCIHEPNIEKVNKLLKNIIKNIYKQISIDIQAKEKVSLQGYEKIIKDSIEYTSFKHLIPVWLAGRRDRRLLIQVS